MRIVKLHIKYRDTKTNVCQMEWKSRLHIFCLLASNSQHHWKVLNGLGGPVHGHGYTKRSSLVPTAIFLGMVQSTWPSLIFFLPKGLFIAPPSAFGDHHSVKCLQALRLDSRTTCPLQFHSEIPHNRKSFPTMHAGLPFCFKCQFMGGSHNFVKSHIPLCFCAFSGVWLPQSKEQHQPTAVYLRNTGTVHWAQFSRGQCLLLPVLPCHVSTNMCSNILMLSYIQDTYIYLYTA